MSKMKYYYADNNIKHGPFTLEELKKEPIKKSTLVWREDMTEWKKAEEIEETKQFASAEPPPLPNETSALNIINNPILSGSTPVAIKKTRGTGYQKESDASLIGIVLLITPIFIYFISKSNSHSSSYGYTTDHPDQSGMQGVFAMFMIFLRIGCAFWITSIAKRQNRNSSSWAAFGFFFPSIALIVIGTLDQLPLEINVDTNLPIKDQARTLVNQAMEFLNDNRKEEALQLIDAALQVDPTSEFALYKKARYMYDHKSDPDLAFTLFQQVLESEEFGAQVNYYSGLIQVKKKNWDIAKTFLDTAKSKGNSDSSQLLKRYYELKGKYVLTEDELVSKIGSLNGIPYSGKYLFGIQDIDQDKFFNSAGQLVQVNKLGISITFGTKRSKVYVGILFDEIKDITKQASHEILTFELQDDSLLKLSFDKAKDYSDSLATLVKFFKECNQKDCSVVF